MTDSPNIKRAPTVDCGMIDFWGRDRWSYLARPSRFGQGIKSPRRPNFALKMYPIKQSRRSIARRNPTTSEHQDVECRIWCWGGVDTADSFYCTQRLRRRAWADEDAVCISWCKTWVLYSTTISSCRWMWGHSQWIAELHYQTSLPRLWRVDPQVMSQVRSTYFMKGLR
jgi:hypothetical protein